MFSMKSSSDSQLNVCKTVRGAFNKFRTARFFNQQGERLKSLNVATVYLTYHGFYNDIIDDVIVIPNVNKLHQCAAGTANFC